MSAGKVYLRPITAADTSKIVVWRNKDFVRGNFIYQKLFTAEGHMEWLRKQVEPGHVAQFIICVENGQRRGDGCSPGGIKTSTETGDREEDALGCGYGVQAAKLMLQYGFETLHLESIFLRVLEDNAGARKSYEKAGFQRIENRRENVQLEQGVRYVLFMEVKRSTWEKTKNNLGAV